MADLKDATPNICAGGEDMGTGPTCKVCGARPDQTCGRGLLKDAAERDRLRAELAEATRLLREVQVGNGPLWNGQVRAFFARQEKPNG